MGIINFEPSHYAPEYLQIHRRALKNTVYGSGNVVEAIIQNEKVKFRINSTGEIKETAEEAFRVADNMGVTSFSRLTGGGPGYSGSMRGLYGFDERVKGIKEVLKQDQQLMKDFGINNVDQLTFHISSAKIPQGNKEAAKSILKDISEDRGFMFFTKETGTAVKAFVGERELSGKELNDLLTRTGGGLFSSEEILKAMKKGDLGGLFSKAAKRAKGLFSMDGVSLSGNDLMASVYAISGKKNFGESIKVFDTNEDLSRIAATYLESGGKETEENIIRRAMAGKTSTEIEEALAYYGDVGITEFMTDAMTRNGIISSKDGQFASYVSEHADIAAVLKGQKSANDLEIKSKTLYENLISDFEKPYDGSSLINEKFNKFIINGYEKEIESLLKKQKNGKLSERDYLRLKELQNDVATAKMGMDAETIRFFYNNPEKNGEYSLIKGVGTTAEFKEKLNAYTVITSKVNIKTEIGLAGKTDIANIVFASNLNPNVYMDPLAPAFHGQIFSSPEAIEAASVRSRRILDGYKQALDDGVFSPHLKSEIYRQAERSLDDMPTEIKAVAERSKMFAQALKEAIESGRDIREIPQLSNYLMHFVQSQIVREKGGILQPVMEDTFRFSLDTMLAHYSGRAVGADKTTMKAITNLRLSGEEGFQEIGLMNFRIRGHKMLMGGDAAAIFHHSLGTFDLDDKGIPVMRTMNIFDDQGKNIGERIGFFTFRQPTGPGEYILSMADFDTETIRATFGKNEGLVSHLNDLVNNKEATLAEQRLHQIISPEYLSQNQMRAMDLRFAPTFRDQGELHETMIGLMNKAEEAGVYKKVGLPMDIIQELKGQKYGSTLAMSDDLIKRLTEAGVDAKSFAAAYNQGNLFKVFAKAGTFNLENSTKDFIFKENNLLNSSEKTELQQAMIKADKGFEDVALQKKLAEIAERENRSSVLEPLIEEIGRKEFQAKTILARQLEDPLGLYINRLTLAAAPTRQSMDIMSKLDDNVVSRLLAEHRVGLIAPSDAVDISTQLTIGNRILTKEESKAFITATQANDIEGIVRGGMESGRDASGIARALASLAGKSTETSAQAIKVLDLVGSESVKKQGAFIGAMRAAAYKQGLTSAEDMLGMDESIMRQRLTGNDAGEFLEGLISGFQKEHARTKMDQSAQDFLDSLINIQKKSKNNKEIKENLIKAIGISKGKYAGLQESTRLASDRYLELKRISMTRRSIQKPYMSEALISKEGTQAAEGIMNLHKNLRTQYGSILGETEKYSADYSYASMVANQIIGEKLHQGILTAAKEKNTTVQEIIDNLDFMSGMDKSEKSIDRYITSGEDPNDLMKLIQGARDSRKMKFYQKQEGLIDLVDKYDSLASMSEEQRTMAISAHREARAQSAALLATMGEEPPSLGGSDLVVEALEKFHTKNIEDIAELTSEENKLIRNIMDASTTRRSLTPEMEAILSSRGDAIKLAPNVLDETDRVAVLGEEAFETSSGLINNKFIKAARESFESGAMKRAIQNPTIRKAGFAGLAIIAASFAYQHKKDRSPEDVSGPPLLPGGSAYESMPQRTPQIPQTSMFSGYDQGKSYSVHIEGNDEQIKNFRSAAGSVAPGSVNSTMYKGLPRLGSNPYSQIASSY